MTQLDFFKTFGVALAVTLEDEHLAMRIVSRAWMEHKRRGRMHAA